METVDQQPRRSLRAVIFDDSREAIGGLSKVLEAGGFEVRAFTTNEIDATITEALMSFQPNLLVIDLLFDASKEEGFGLLRQLSEIKALQTTPIVVCSKFITDSDAGRALEKRLREVPAVKEVFGKFASYPSPDAFVRIALEEP